MEKRVDRTKAANRGAATAGDVLGGAATINPKFQKYYDRLVEMRDKLVTRRGDLGEIAPVEEANHNTNVADRGTDEYDLGAQFGQFASDQEALFEIDQALRRIDDGAYGICEATGKPIPEERLDAIPWTRFAKNVEGEIERERQSRKPQHIL
jgi:DnaK suppressor protein